MKLKKKIKIKIKKIHKNFEDQNKKKSWNVETFNIC
jgi:hypothetical protein